MSESSPAEKAAAAAEALAAKGQPVTARAVRAQSGVGMAVATEAARLWNEAESERGGAPAVPEVVRSRFDALWREAYQVARAEFDQARLGWETKLRQAAEEAAGLGAAVDDAEQETKRVSASAVAAAERAAAELEAARAKAAEEIKDLEAQLAADRSRADRAEGALAAITGERDRLLIEIAALRKSA